MMVLFAVALPVIILFCGLSLDVGMLEVKKLQLQSAADAAALAAILEAERGTGNWKAQARDDASVNGFTNGVNGVTVTISQRPSYGAYAGRYDALQAVVTQTVTTLFMGALNGGHTTLTAQAAGLMTPCLYFTGTGALQSYTLDGYTGDSVSPTCPVYVNKSLRDQSSASMVEESVIIAGPSSASSLSGYVYPSPTFSIPALNDPLGTIVSPSFSACDHVSYALSNGSATLNPGTYCKGLNLTNSTVTLNPGRYIITGGANWSGSTVSGTGITLFFTQGGGGSYGQFKIQNFSTVNLSAANDTANNAIPAILVFADRNWIPTATQDFILSQSFIQGDGVWYLKSAGFYLWSCGTFTGPHYMGVLADNGYFAGSHFLAANNYSYVTTGNPFHAVGGLVQ